MENMPEFNSDRRHFFRINDRLFIDVRELSPSMVKQVAQTIHTPSATDSENQEKQQLSTIQASLIHLVEQINQNDRHIARAIRLLDEKVSIISHMVQRQKNASDKRSMIDANLSGGGIAFKSAVEYSHKTMLELHIELQPSGTIIHAIASVVCCEPSSDLANKEPFYLRLAFTDMNEYDRDFLVKHTLTHQAETLRMTQK